MHETCKLPTASLRASNLHPSSAPNRGAPQETMPNSRSAKSDTVRQNATGRNENSCTRARARGNGVPFPFPWHELRPDRSGCDVWLGVAVSEPSYTNRSNRIPGAKPLTEFILMY